MISLLNTQIIERRGNNDQFLVQLFPMYFAPSVRVFDSFSDSLLSQNSNQVLSFSEYSADVLLRLPFTGEDGGGEIGKRGEERGEREEEEVEVMMMIVMVMVMVIMMMVMIILVVMVSMVIWTDSDTTNITKSNNYDTDNENNRKHISLSCTIVISIAIIPSLSSSLLLL